MYDLSNECGIINAEFVQRKCDMAEKNVIDLAAARSRRNKKKKKTKEKKPLSPRRKQQIKRRLTVFLVVAAFLLLTVGFSFYKIVSLKVEESKLQQEQEELKEERDALQQEMKDVKSPEYIEKQAREQLHLLLPGEILYMLPGEDDNTDGSDDSGE